MIEIALSLAIIGFAMVAIIGVLPIGMNMQKDNREETIINQEATVFLNALRNGAQGLDDLTNYVMAITNYVTRYDQTMRRALTYSTNGYTYNGSWQNGASLSPPFPIINGLRIVGLLSTPKYMPWGDARIGGFYSNHVVAYVRSMSGAASEKFPQNNQSMQDLAFSYRMVPEVVTYGFSYVDSSWGNPMHTNLQNNLHEVRLTFNWPLLSRGKAGSGGQAFRVLVGGSLQETNQPGFLNPTPGQPSAYDLYFFDSRNYVH